MKYFIKSETQACSDQLMKDFRDLLYETDECRRYDQAHHTVSTNEHDFIFCSNANVNRLTQGIHDKYIYSSEMFKMAMRVYEKGRNNE